MSLRKPSYKTIVRCSLAMFALLFGAGNVIYPILVGVSSAGGNLFIGLFSFCITAVAIPIIGIIAIVLFGGDYKEFFYRIGAVPGSMFIALCMLILGPLLATPRIIAISHLTVNVLIPMASYLYVPFFLSIVFLCSFRERYILSLLSTIITPLLIMFLIVVAAQALWYGEGPVVDSAKDWWEIFFRNIHRGYETLDLIAAIFFSSTILVILQRSMGIPTRKSHYKDVVKVGLKAGALTMTLLGFSYGMLSIVGLYRSHAISNESELHILQKALYLEYSKPFMVIIVLLACLSTAIGYAVVISTYIQKEIFNNKISYATCLACFLILCVPLSFFGDTVMALARGPVVYIFYPVLLVLSCLNCAYKLYGVQMVKLPTAVAALLSIVLYIGYTYWFRS